MLDVKQIREDFPILNTRAAWLPPDLPGQRRYYADAAAGIGAAGISLS